MLTRKDPKGRLELASMTFAAETPAKHPDFKGPLAPSEHDACGSHLWQPFVLLLHCCTARTSRVLPKVCAKFSQQRPSACSYTGLSTLCLNACYRGPWQAKLCRARGTALRALEHYKGPNHHNKSVIGPLPYKVLPMRT